MAIFTRDQRELLTHVLLLNRSVDRWCKDRREAGLSANAPMVMGKLVACLDLLEQHFSSEIDQEIGRGVAA
jgi:hypothetical protein